MFSEWLGKDEPKGLEAAKNRILNEARRKAAPLKVFKDPNVVDPKVVAQAKEREADAARRAAVAKDRAAGNVDDPFQDTPQQTTTRKPTLSLNPNTNLGGGTKPPPKPPAAAAPEPEDDNPQKAGKPSLNDLLGDIQGERDLSYTTVNQRESGEGRIAGHELGSSVRTAKDLNDIVEQRDARRKKYEEDMKNLDLAEGVVDEDVRSRRKIIDDLLSNIGEGTTTGELRDRFIALAARAATYPRKVRAGKGARSITSDDRDSILQEANIKRLIDGYGDGSWESVAKLGNSMKILKDAMSEEEWDEVTEKWWGVQPENIRSVFGGAGGLGSKDGGDDMHFNGFDEDNNKIAGGVNNYKRTMALAKVFLQQGGLDGYTGRPLEFEHMEPDHIRGFSQLINGKTPGKEDRMMADHPDNWIWTSTGINNIKSNDSIPDFLRKLQDMTPAAIKKLMGNSQLNLQDEGQRYLTDDTTDFARSFVTNYKDEEGDVNILSDALTQDIIDTRQGQQDTMIKSLQEMGAKVDESRLLTDIFAAGGQVPKQHRLNLPSQNKKDVRERSQTRLGDNAMREMYRVMVGKPPAQQAKIARAWKQAWNESIDEIKRQFKLSDAGEGFTNQDLITNEDGSMRGGPSLRKLFGLKIAQLLGEDGEMIKKQIRVNEMMTDLDIQIILG